MKQILLSLLVLVSTLISTDALAQGSTTAAISGTVLDENGEALPGATIKAIHQPTGTVYGIVSNTDGRYRIANMQVGGPYEVTTTFVGFRENIKNDIFLTLGQTLNLNLNMQETATELDEIEIISRRDAIIDGNRTGAETVVNKERIKIRRQLPGQFSILPALRLRPTSERAATALICRWAVSITVIMLSTSMVR